MQTNKQIKAPQKPLRSIWPNAPFKPAKKRGVVTVKSFRYSRGSIVKANGSMFSRGHGFSNEY